MITEKLTIGLNLIFVGFNPSPTSFESGFNYAGRNNRFYQILYESGLTNRAYEPSESPQLLQVYGYGFTNLVMRPTRRADEVSVAEYRAGSAILREKLRTLCPRVVCYVGKGVYQRYARRAKVAWGFQYNDVIPGITDFVAPGTSGLVRMKLSEQVAVYRELARFLADIRG